MSRPPRARAPLKGAALELFVRHGVHATGIREIARHARCSEAALYRHWPSKEALIVSLFEEHLGEVVAILDEAVNTVGDISHRVRTATAAVLRLYDDQPLVFRFVLLVRYEIATSLPADRRMPQDVLEELMRAHDPENAVLLAAAAMGIFLQVADHVIFGRLPGPLSHYHDQVTNLVLRTMGL